MKYAARILIAVLALGASAGTQPPAALQALTAAPILSPELTAVHPLPELGTPKQDSAGVHGGSPESRAEVAMAMARFDEAGLGLPPLRIYLHNDRAGCAGHPGIFNQDYSGTRLDLCTADRRIILHELAHAWEHHAVDDTTRQAFLALFDLEVWNDADTDWDDRGVERAAQIMAEALMPMPLDPHQYADLKPAYDAYELLTGKPSPRLETISRTPAADHSPEPIDVTAVVAD